METVLRNKDVKVELRAYGTYSHKSDRIRKKHKDSKTKPEYFTYDVKSNTIKLNVPFNKCGRGIKKVIGLIERILKQYPSEELVRIADDKMIFIQAGKNQICMYCTNLIQIGSKVYAFRIFDDHITIIELETCDNDVYPSISLINKHDTIEMSQLTDKNIQELAFGSECEAIAVRVNTDTITGNLLLYKIIEDDRKHKKLQFCYDTYINAMFCLIHNKKGAKIFNIL